MVTTYTVVLTLHVLSAITFLSGVVVAGIAFEAARRREQPVEIALLLGLTRVGVLLVLVGSVLAGVCGLWLVHLGHWGYGTGWIQLSIGLYVAALVLGGLGGRRPKEARLLACRLAVKGAPVGPELRARLDDRVSQAANYLSLLALLSIVALMCIKP